MVTPDTFRLGQNPEIDSVAVKGELFPWVFLSTCSVVTSGWFSEVPDGSAVLGVFGVLETLMGSALFSSHQSLPFSSRSCVSSLLAWSVGQCWNISAHVARAMLESTRSLS